MAVFTILLYRIKVIQTFLEKNTNNYLVHSDLDAIWKKNICEELFNKNNNTDLFFSQGTVFPDEHLKKHKFVLCCGFFCIKSNEKTINFFNKYINNLIKIKDDQKAINLELINTKWNTNNEPEITNNKKYVYYDNDLNGYNSDYDINILLISFNKIQREFLNNNGYIYHILTPKICSEKIHSFKKLKII
uniref:Nucleotide-diphospho-sugar transferase n=1 Tax=Mimiviridae sp. ChoanoV1 TaxID=2596887 RepID=A0A5B8IIZ7_9VIRU|nr:nucleotide-diphospho-sugar transferase [Mimiviridae sp. ChoanoV1]